MMLEVRHLRVVEAIKTEGGVSRAAQRLHLTQSAVSHCLRGLERRLGVRLFTRQADGMVATAAGERLLRTAGVVLDELGRAERDLTGGATAGPVVRLTTQCYLCYHWLPGVLRLFLRDLPGAELRLVPEAARRPYEALLAAEVDLAIVTTVREETGLMIEPLFSDDMVALMTASNPLADREQLAAADFADEHLIMHPGAETSLLYRLLLSPAGIRPQRLTELPMTEAVVETVKAGLGITVMPRWVVARELAAGSLRAVHLQSAGARITWYAAMHGRSPVLGALRELLYHLRCRMTGSPEPR